MPDPDRASSRHPLLDRGSLGEQERYHPLPALNDYSCVVMDLKVYSNFPPLLFVVFQVAVPSSFCVT